MLPVRRVSAPRFFSRGEIKSLLHIGGVRTALFNYLFAKQNNGKFLIRVEDTDTSRFVPEAEKYIIDSLNWLGIVPDEGINPDGTATYRQSERKEIYKKYVQELVDKGFAYYAFDTPDELEKMRMDFGKPGEKDAKYDSVTRQYMKNSYTLSEDEIKQHLATGDYVVRFRNEKNHTFTFTDMIRGEITFNTSNLDDKVIYKGLQQLPTYHLANVVDDHLMEVTHVIRGEEWIPSTPLHILLYDAFGWDKPEFYHLPLILRPNGHGKLSKRDGDLLGFPVHPMGFKELGFEPSAVVNFLAFLGWNPGTEKEIYTLEELKKDFCFQDKDGLFRVQKTGAKFNFDKAKWFNKQHLKNIDVTTLVDNDGNLLIHNFSKDYIQKAFDVVVERLETRKDFWRFAKYFFQEYPLFNTTEENADTGWMEKYTEEVKKFFDAYLGVLETTEDFSADNLNKITFKLIEDSAAPRKDIMALLRIALTGGVQGATVFQIAEVLGKDKTITRIYDFSKSASDIFLGDLMLPKE